MVAEDVTFGRIPKHNLIESWLLHDASQSRRFFSILLDLILISSQLVSFYFPYCRSVFVMLVLEQIATILEILNIPNIHIPHPSKAGSFDLLYIIAAFGLTPLN